MATQQQSAKHDLLRQEALDAQSVKSVGEVLLRPRVSMWLLCFLSVLIAAAVIAFFYSSSYTRRTTVTGQLAPSAGIMRVTSPQAGVVLERRVSEGQSVSKGDVLFVLTSDRVGLGHENSSGQGLGQGMELQARVGEQINERRRSLEAEISRNKSAQELEISSLLKRMASLKDEANSIAKLIEQQKNRVAMAQDARNRYQGLAEKDYIPREQFTQKEVELSEQTSRLQTLQRDALANQREAANAQRDIEGTKSRYQGLNAGLQRNISASSQELTELEARRRVVIAAPENGLATLISAEVGQAVDLGKVVASITPKQSALEAKLYAPSRNMGFVKVGDTVLLRYQAYPYQKFGQHEGRVKAISNVPTSNQELAGFALPELAPGEPVYSITVDLAKQSLMAYGENRALQTGMRLEADILQETRKLWEWALEPLYSVTGKMR